MSIRSALSRLLSMRGRRQPVAVPDTEPELVDWPLADALPIAPPEPRRPVEGTSAPGIRLFAYPFDLPDVAELVRDVWSSSPDGTSKDGRYCEFMSGDGSRYYIPCARLISVLRQGEGQLGKGLSRLRLVALDSFGYEEEARELFHEFETEMGPPMAAMGFARVLLGNNHPRRALEFVSGARQRGASGAALAACEARMSFACGLAPQGIRLAAEALRTLPDPHWMPADHSYTWGLLHGAALASRENVILRHEVLRALDSLCESDPSPRRALACANLAALIGDPSASNRAAQAALDRAGEDNDVAAEAAWMLNHVRDRDRLIAHLSQPPASMDPRRAAIDVAGWFLDGRQSRLDRSTWRDGDDDTIALTVGTTPEDLKTGNLEALRRYCRQIAENHGAGLVEADVVLGQLGPAVQLIYKKLEGAAFTFTGVQMIALPKASLTWSVVAHERGTTGIREAKVTSSLMSLGQLTPEMYTESWACDPYEPRYRGVDRSTLRYMSDDPSYDALFPQHPLSKVRRVLRDLSRRSDVAAVVPGGHS
jgi:hypothetical protein